MMLCGLWELLKRAALKDDVDLSGCSRRVKLAGI
jgi:hypothetical protein